MIKIENDTKNERVMWPDDLRVIAIFSVIILHTAAKGYDGSFRTGSVEFQICNIYSSLTRFCVPLFVMLSGMFLLNPQKNYDFKVLYLKKIPRLITAYIVWSFVYSIITIIDMGGVINCANIIYYMYEGHYHLWFIYMILGLYIVTPILRKIATDDTIIIYFILLSILLVFIPNFISVFMRYKYRKILIHFLDRIDIRLVAGYSAYYLLGYYISMKNTTRNKRMVIYILGLISVLLTIGLNSRYSLKTGKIDLYVSKNLMINVFAITVAIFLLIKNIFESVKFSQIINCIIRKIAVASFGIYLVHAMILDHLHLIGLKYFFITPVFSIPIISTIVLFISYIIVCCLNKIPFVNKYII